MMWMQSNLRVLASPIEMSIHVFTILVSTSQSPQLQEFSSSAQHLYSFPIQLLDKKETINMRKCDKSQASFHVSI